jgi:hypothetical protein
VGVGVAGIGVGVGGAGVGVGASGVDVGGAGVGVGASEMDVGVAVRDGTGVAVGPAQAERIAKARVRVTNVRPFCFISEPPDKRWRPVGLVAERVGVIHNFTAFCPACKAGYRVQRSVNPSPFMRQTLAVLNSTTR